MRIFIVGDTHCDSAFIEKIGKKVLEFDCDVIMQLGDFGWWPKFDKHFRKACSELGLPIHFIAGNHDHHWDLNRIVADHHAIGKDEFIEVSKNVFYAPTGLRWTWGEKDFLAVGGAWSIDKDSRTTGIDWFPEEIISDEQVELASSQGKVDVIFSHDTPLRTDLSLEFSKRGDIFMPIGDTNLNRNQLEKIVLATQPSRLYHGHWHMDWVQYVDGLRIEGLDCNFNPIDSWTVLDTEEI